MLDESADRAKYDAAVKRYVPAAGQRMLKVERSCRSADAVASSWKAVGSRSWSADARLTTFVADVDPATEDVVVEYDRATTSAASVSGLSSLEGVSAKASGVAQMSRLNDTPDGGHWGGARFTSALKNCTAGFSVVRRSNDARASVTAGHCGGVGTSRRSGSNYYGTTSVRTNYPDYDQALLTGSTYGPKTWTDGPGDSANTRTVVGGADPAVCASVCQSGSFSTSPCGITIRSLSSKYCDADGCTTYVIRATRGGSTAIIGGDSGGPVYSRPSSTTATIRGMAFAGSGCTAGRCTTLYAERYKSISGHLGVYALTGCRALVLVPSDMIPPTRSELIASLDTRWRGSRHGGRPGWQAPTLVPPAAWLHRPATNWSGISPRKLSGNDDGVRRRTTFTAPSQYAHPSPCSLNSSANYQLTRVR